MGPVLAYLVYFGPDIGQTLENWIIVSGLECYKQDISHYHLKTGPFDDQTHFSHLNMGLVRYSNAYFITQPSIDSNNPNSGHLNEDGIVSAQH